MKCRLIRDDLRAARSAPDDAEGIEVRNVLRNGSIQPVRFYRKGAVIEHPDAYKLVRQGVAESADAECELKTARSPEQLAAAQYAYERQSRGILPEDFGRYDRGEILRMRPDGTYEPGPNAPVETDEDEDDDE